MSTKTYFSNRIYKNTLSNNVVDTIQHSLFVFNKAKHYRLQREVREKRGIASKLPESMHLHIKKKFNLNDYYTNSVVQEGKALLSSQNELTKLYISNKKEQIKAIKKKIKSTKSRLTVLRKIKNSIIKGKPTFNKTSREQKRGSLFVVEYKKATKIFFNIYDFEHFHIDKEIKHLSSRLGRLNFRLDRVNKQIDTLENNISSVCFGSKKLARAKHTVEKYKQNPSLWKEEWKRSRYGKMTISGRKDAKFGNFVFFYNTVDHSLTFKAINDSVVKLENITFPYGQKSIDECIDFQVNAKNKKDFGQPIAWSIEDKGDYYIIKCMLEIPKSPYVNHSKDSGLIGVDLNVDHFAVSNVNEIGQLLESFTLNFDVHNKSSGQLKKIIELEAINLIDYAVKHKKGIVLERLNTTKSKLSNPYGNKKANQRMSLFAYNIMITAIKSRADKLGVEVHEVNPAYTSQIGKMKYMKRFGISIHESASYVIARRALGFKEKLPPVLHSLVPEKKQGLHHWAHWAHISRLLSFVRVQTFYQIELSNLYGSTPVKWSSLFPKDALKDFEGIGLSKLDSRKS